MPKLSVLAAIVTALALGLAACGGSSKSSSSAAAPATSSSPGTGTGAAGTGTGGGASTTSAAAGGGEQSIAADPSGKLAYTKKSLSAKAGTVKIAFTNKSPLAHNLTIQKGTNGAVLGATPTFQSATKLLTVKLAPGTYTFFCSVPGHRMAGMVGTLKVS